MTKKREIIPVEENDIIPAEILTACDLITTRRKGNSKKKTAKSFVRKRPDGFDYVDEAYMREQLNLTYPGLWGWEGHSWEIKGDWVVVAATLWIIEPETSIKRSFFSVGSARIQFKRGTPHEMSNVIDLDKNVASANAFAFKRAINRLCNIADDVYKKVSEDLSLSDKQIAEIKTLMKDGKVTGEIESAILRKIDCGQVNTENIDEVHKYIKEKTNG